ncbi:hypothetical protein ACPFP2_21465 [Micromonospora citrea]|uniref:hypothetical protein n=1 Tax=Micromonospora citrea TaxID=47855 RepID=UPI003C5DB6E4
MLVELGAQNGVHGGETQVQPVLPDGRRSDGRLDAQRGGGTRCADTRPRAPWPTAPGRTPASRWHRAPGRGRRRASAAISAAGRGIAASTGYEIYVKVAQDLIPVEAIVDVWSTEPDLDRPLTDWALALNSGLECPSGQLVLSDSTGSGFDDIDPPEGPGSYSVAVFHKGREQARCAQEAALAAMRGGRVTRETNEIEREHAGIEQYLIKLSWSGPLSPDGDDDR